MQQPVRPADGGGKTSELSLASSAAAVVHKPTSPAVAAVAAVAKFHRALSSHSNASAHAAEQDPQALLKSFRRNKHARARLLMPLGAGDAEPSSPRSNRASPRKARVATPSSTPLPINKQSLLARLLPHDEDRCEPNNHHDQDDQQGQIATLARVHALLASPDEIHRWLATYETEKHQFASFALFTEMKLDEIHDRYVMHAARPNAVEAAACCATLLKMPGLVACYHSLLEKLAIGLLSVVYLPVEQDSDDQPCFDDASMATLVRGFYARKPYFQRVQELEMQAREARSLTDPSVLLSLTVDEIQTMALQIPVRVLSEGIVRAYARHLPHLDYLLERVQETKLQLQLEFYQLHGRRRRVAKQRSTASGLAREEDDEEEEDPDYPVTIPLTSSAQICRAIAQHAATFSASGKEMILCSMLEHIDVESFKDVFKRFDAHGKTCFLHHLSVLESSDHLQLILEALPNAGEMLFRFYHGICGSGSGTGRSDDPKHVFFHKVLSAEMEFFFLCDLAAYLTDEQWTLLSQEYDKHVQARKARRLRLRRRILDGEDQDDGDGADGEDEEEGEVVATASRKIGASGAAGSLEQFQTMVANYLHRHKLTSADLWWLLQTALMPSLEEAEISACIDYCMDRLPQVGRWRKLLAIVEEMHSHDDGTSDNDGALELVRRVRVKMLKTLVAMLSNEDRVAWLEKTATKHGLCLAAKPQPPPARKEPVPVVAPVIIQAPPPPKSLNLEDPKPYILPRCCGSRPC
jgi:hypothetical protein